MSNFRGQPSSSAGGDRVRSTHECVFVREFFSKGHAGHFAPEGSAGYANMSIPAINAMQNMITQVNVRSHQPTSAPTSENPDHKLLIQVLHSLLVTSIKAARFENLVAGLSPAHKTLLVEGFWNGFLNVLHRRIILF